jgi:hypothetical protein
VSTTAAHLNLLPDVPEPDAIRRRLAVVVTEAALLRSQLRVSVRLHRERERLRRLCADAEEVCRAE